MDKVEVADKRYRVLVLFRRSDRPRHWDFHCPACRTKVAEISGKELYALDDAVDVSAKATTGLLCPGQYRTGCDIWFYLEEF